MNVLVTGAGGFIGAGLVARLLTNGGPFTTALSRLVLLDQRVAEHADDRVRVVIGDCGDADVLFQALEVEPDVVFHLVSIPGGLAEQDFELGLKVNLDSSIRLLEALRRRDRRVRFVFASSVAVYGAPMPALIDEDTPAAPTMSYGAHKRIVELLVDDYSRRGYIDGCSLRLPGVVARPEQPSGLLSAFMSDAIRLLAAGRPYEFPVSATGTAWWMSRACAVDNLLHAAALAPEVLTTRRVWLLPVLRASMREIVDAIADVHGRNALANARFAPKAHIQAQFASCPLLRSTAAAAAGFEHDGALSDLVRRALAN
jgi:D-erythronate 2-dehydrogenase